jgi:hypothetical protein
MPKGQLRTPMKSSLKLETFLAPFGPTNLINCPKYLPLKLA